MGALGWAGGCAAGGNKKRQQAQAMGAQDPWLIAGATVYGCLFEPDKKVSRQINDAARKARRWWRKAKKGVKGLWRDTFGSKTKKKAAPLGFEAASSLLIASLERPDNSGVPMHTFARGEGREWKSADVGRVLHRGWRLRAYGRPAERLTPDALYAGFASLWAQAKGYGWKDSADMWTVVFWALGRNLEHATPGPPDSWPLLPPAVQEDPRLAAAFAGEFIDMPSPAQRLWDGTKTVVRNAWPLAIAAAIRR